jgi:NAD-dependent deacetylase
MFTFDVEANVPQFRYPGAFVDRSSAPTIPLVTAGSHGAARSLIERSTSVVVITGAGVSTGSGIPDFRGPDGIWTKDPAAERRATIDAYVESSEIRVASWQRRLLNVRNPAQPNPAHFALAAFERTGKLAALVTQNVDGLHLVAGSDPRVVIEIHGSPRTTRCLQCGAEWPTTVVLERVANGDLDPRCVARTSQQRCGGVLKTTVVSFGQQLPHEEFARAEFAVRACDLLICVGSTLTVYPVSGLVPGAVTRGARLLIVNADPTPFDALADEVVRDDIPTVLGTLLGVA